VVAWFKIEHKSRSRVQDAAEVQVSTPEDPPGRHCSGQLAGEQSSRPTERRHHDQAGDARNANDADDRNMPEGRAILGSTLAALTTKTSSGAA